MKKNFSLKFFWLLDIILAGSTAACMIGDDLSGTAAIAIFLTIFVAASPLPLALSSPLALWLGKRRGRKENLLFRSGAAIKVLNQVDTLALCKNGTVTEGKPYITDLVPEGVSQGHLLALAASAEQISPHPVAKAIYAAALERDLRLQRISAYTEVPGCGVEAIMGGNPLKVGTPSWVQEEGFKLSANLLTKIDQLAYKGKMLVLVTNGRYPRGIIALEDDIRPETISAIHLLQRQGLKVMLLTGDSHRTANAIKRLTEIDEVRAELTPEKKVREIQLMRAKGAVVAMAGSLGRDGAVFAAVDLVIHLGESAPVAAESRPPDLSLPGGLSDLLKALRLAKKAQKICRQNRWLAYLTWLVLIPLSLGALLPLGFAYPSLEIVGAAVGAMCLIIILNSVRMK